MNKKRRGSVAPEPANYESKTSPQESPTVSLYTVLDDKSSTGKQIDWRGKKEKSLKISGLYGDLKQQTKSERVGTCGNYLEFKSYSDGQKKLHKAYFCRNRLCPMCNWRRSRKIFGQLSKIMNYIAVNNVGTRYLFLTLTLKNCKGADLHNTVDTLLQGYKLLFEHRSIRKNKTILGSYRCLEVTHNINRRSKSYDTYHPHLHIVLAVSPDYFSLDNYIPAIQSTGKKKSWQDLWKTCIKADYDPIIYIEAVDDTAGARLEVSKYPLKDVDILGQPYQKQLETLELYDTVLAGRRLVGFKGIFNSVRKQLKLDDVTDGDLINTDIDDGLNPDLGYIIERYRWYVGYNNYTLIAD